MRIKWAVGFVSLILLSGFTSQAQENGKRAELARWMKQRQTLVANRDVVAYYDFQEGEGTTLKNKSKAGAALDGTIHGAKWVEGRWPGKTALRFDGLKSLVQIPSVDALCALDKEQGGSGEITIEVWMNATSTQEAGNRSSLSF